MGVFRTLKKAARKARLAASQLVGRGGGLENEVELFILSGEWFSLVSSCAESARYDFDSEQLSIEYRDGEKWTYGNVSEAEARAFYTAPSHGVWIWDNIRVRGTVHEHRKPAWRIS